MTDEESVHICTHIFLRMFVNGDLEIRRERMHQSMMDQGEIGGANLSFPWELLSNAKEVDFML